MARMFGRERRELSRLKTLNTAKLETSEASRQTAAASRQHMDLDISVEWTSVFTFTAADFHAIPADT
jgi:hypothetical protein